MRRRRSLRALWRWLRGVRTGALVGKSGTGKSFRAHLIAEKNGMDIIVDDGLIISNRTILFGRSSKKELTMRAAVRKALFDEPMLRAKAQRVLKSRRIHRVLILGTSVEMVERIADNLDFPRPSELYHIEDIASEEEIRAARWERSRKRIHSLPLPPVAVRLGPYSAVKDKVRDILQSTGALRRARPVARAGQTAPAVRPKGGVSFTKSAVGQMIHHCIQEFDPALSLTGLTLNRTRGLYSLGIRLKVPFEHTTSGALHDLREYIIRSLETHAGILVEEVALVVDNVGNTAARSAAPTKRARERP